MAKKSEIIVKDVVIKTMTKDGIDYLHHRHRPTKECY